jgi:RimJ/RimL family protein N-acetyltransferase
MRHDLTLARDEVRLEPLEHRHGGGLLRLLDAQMWAGMTSPLPADPAAMQGYIAVAHGDPTRQAFAVVDVSTGEVRGCTSFYEYAPSQDRIEVGHTFYGRQFWGGRTNPLCKWLMFVHAFEVLAVHRLAMRCDIRNRRSQQAILRLGAVREGTLREHRVAPDGSRRDTVYFSVLAPEWPSCRTGLERRLARTPAAD